MGKARSFSVLRTVMGGVVLPVAVAWGIVSLARAAARVARRAAVRLFSAHDGMAARAARLRQAPTHRRALRRASAGAAAVVLCRAPRWLARRWSRASS